VCLLGPHELLSARDDWTTRLRAHVERAEAAAAEAEDESSGSTGSSKMNEFAVSEIHIIHAEVKLMKLICDGVVVDVSANQFGGLAALGFLEEVNAFIGKDEIFKRSIVLIKAWGFYEGRLLGAHHALISTYALETLVLYILNRFHRELSTPLEVLHKFLVFFATFDWDNNAVSVVGPIPLDDLDAATGPIGKRPEVHAEGALLTPDFMWRMMDKYGNDSVTAKLAGTKPGDPKPAHRPMARKYLNVVDPLLSSNNLGRSVSQGNAKRIRKALALGAKRLTALRESSTGGECFGAVRMLEQFFGNTMRHRRLGPMPHLPMAGASTPAGFAGRNHADEVSMTPARCPRTGAVSVLASPSSPSQYQSPLPPARDSPVVGSASSRMATKGTEAPAAKVAGRRPTLADDADGGMPARRLEMTSPRKEGGDGGGSDDAVAEDHWPHLERVGTRCPVLQRAEKAAAAEKAERDLHGEERGPFWGRWDPLPASEAIAQHARAFATSEGFPTTHSEGMSQGGKGGRCPVLAAAAREEEEVVASAIPSGCPFHFESRREADERRMDPIESTHAARSDGSSDESSKEAKSASPTGPLSDGDGEGKAADVKPADEKVRGREAGSAAAAARSPAAGAPRAHVDGRSTRPHAPRDELPDVLPGARAANPAAAATRAAVETRSRGASPSDRRRRRRKARHGRLHRRLRSHLEPPPVRPGVPPPRDRSHAIVRRDGRDRDARGCPATVRWPKGRRRRCGVQPAAEQGRRRPRRARQERQLGRGRRGQGGRGTPAPASRRAAE
jgi:syndecan 1